MLERARSFALVSVIIVILSVSAVGGLFYLFQKERNKNIELQESLDEVKTRLKITEGNLDDYKKKSSDLEMKFKTSEENMARLNSELQQERMVGQQAQSQVDRLKADLDQQKGLRADLEGKLTQAQNDLKNVQSNIKQLQAQKAELEAKLEELAKEPPPQEESEGVELGKVVVTPDGGLDASVSTVKKPAQKVVVEPKVVERPKKKTSQSAKEGKVLVINKNYNFVVINLGSQDGVSVGTVFSVYHNNKLVGDVKVEKIHDSMAAAGFITADIRDKVTEGDKVVQKNK